jgi:hypothetical protein
MQINKKKLKNEFHDFKDSRKCVTSLNNEDNVFEFYEERFSTANKDPEINEGKIN